MKVNLSRIHSFVPKPQSNNRTINARLKQIHRGAVPKNVRRDTFVLERRTMLTCRGHMLGEQILNSVSTQWLAARVGEDWIDRLAVSFTQPGTQERYGVLAEWNTSGFAALSCAAHMSTGFQDDILTAQTDYLRQSQSCLQGQQK